MKKLFYLMLLLCTNFITPAAYNPNEKRSNALQSQTDQTEQDERKKRKTSKIIYIQSSIEYDSHESLPVEMKIAQNQSRTLNELITLDQEQDIDPTEKVYQFLLFDTQTLKDIINLMTIAEQQPEEIDNEIKKIMTVAEKQPEETETLKGIISLMTIAEQQPEEIDNEIKKIMTATEKNPQEIDDKVNIFALLYAADFFQAIDAIKAALIKYLFTQEILPEDHDEIIAFLNKFLASNVVDDYMSYILNAAVFFQASNAIKNALIKYLFTQEMLPEDHDEIIAFLSKFLAPTIVRNYMPYIAKQYFLRYDKMPEEWKKIHFKLSVSELPEHKKQIRQKWGKTTLNLGGNFLTSLDGLIDIPNIEKVEDLDISDNNISSWEHMPLLPNLQELDVLLNSFSNWVNMPLFPNLQELSIGGNNISSWKHMPLFPNLRNLNIMQNSINNWEHMPLFPNLRGLLICRNKINSFKYMPLLPSLRQIIFEENNLSEIEKERARKMFPRVAFYF